MVPLWQKKSVWQVTTIIQPALCHLVTSHFQEIACNWTPKDQIRWPIFLMLLCMIVLTEKTSKFPQPIIFWILVFFMSQDDAHYQNNLNAPGTFPLLCKKSAQEFWRAPSIPWLWNLPHNQVLLPRILDKGGFLHFNWVLFSATSIILMLEKERTSGA